MKVTALAPWFGSNRMLAENVGAALEGCSWVGVPFAGGMCELAHIKATSIVVNDLHRHVINLATIVRDFRPELQAILGAMPFHPEILAASQQACLRQEEMNELPPIPWAANYFVTQWMGRSGKAGTDNEFTGKLSTRWNANGGDSAKRFRSAVESLSTWEVIMRRCNFSTLDVFAFLERVKENDAPKHGIYCDPPFPEVGGEYKHKFGPDQHRRLAVALASFEDARIVCRFYDHPLIREFYPEPEWTWNRLAGRDQANNAEKPEVLLVRERVAARKRRKPEGTLFGEVG